MDNIVLITTYKHYITAEAEALDFHFVISLPFNIRLYCMNY